MLNAYFNAAEENITKYLKHKQYDNSVLLQGLIYAVLAVAIEIKRAANRYDNDF